MDAHRLRQVAGIAADAEARDGTTSIDEATWLALRHRPDDVAGLVEDDGFALVIGTELTLAVRPQARGEGLGGSLLARTLAGPAVPTLAWSHGDHPAAAALGARHGFDRAREMWVMRRPISAALPAAPGDPRIRTFRHGDEDEVLRVNAAAFVDHPEQGALDATGLADRMTEPWFDPQGLLVAEEDGRLLGFHWTKRHDARHGEVYVVAIAPEAQGKGLGRSLTLAGLRHLHGTLGSRGEVLLYVESDNAPALAVYRRLGFEHRAADTHVQYHRPAVTAPPEPVDPR